MTKAVAILLGLALVWATAWTIAGYAMHSAGSEKLAQAEHVRTPAMRLERGAEVRFEGTIAEGPKTKALYSEKECLAGYVYVAVWGSYQDSQNKTVSTSSPVAVRRVGPETIGIVVGDSRLELPLERWAPSETTTEAVNELPPRLGVTQAEVGDARAKLRGSGGRLMVSEGTLDAGTRFFVVGRLEDREGPLLLEPDPRFDAVVLFSGTREQYVEKLSGSGGGLQITGWIFGAGLGPLPLSILGLVQWLRWRKRTAPSPAAAVAP
jgi:hypothetical protein